MVVRLIMSAEREESISAREKKVEDREAMVTLREKTVQAREDTLKEFELFLNKRANEFRIDVVPPTPPVAASNIHVTNHRISREELSRMLSAELETVLQTKGEDLAGKLPALLSVLADAGWSMATRKSLAETFEVWCGVCSSSLRKRVVVECQSQIFDTISLLCTGDVSGGTKAACSIASGLTIISAADTTQMLAAEWAPLSFSTLAKVLDVGRPMDEDLSELCSALIGIKPYSRSCSYAAVALPPLRAILAASDCPDNLRQHAVGAVSGLASVDAVGMQGAGRVVLDMALAGNTSLVTAFACCPQMYTADPGAVHSRLEEALRLPYMMVVTLVMSVSQKYPLVLAPHLGTVVAKLEEEPSMGSATLMALKGVADVAPESVYVDLERIVHLVAQVPHGDTMLAQIIGACGRSGNKSIADAVLPKLVVGLQAAPSMFAAVWLSEINNLCGFLSERDVLTPHLPVIEAQRGANAALVSMIMTFVDGTASVADVAALVQQQAQKIADMQTEIKQLKLTDGQR